MEFIDFHAHLTPSEQARDELISRMSRLGISKACVVAGGVLPPGAIAVQMQDPRPLDIDAPNERIRLLCESSQGRLLPFYFANPMAGAHEYLEQGANYYGLKIGPAIHGLPLVDPRYIPFLEVARNFAHPVYLHCLSAAGFEITSLLKTAKDFPDLSFVLGHAGIGNCDYSSITQIKPFRNIYFETSGGFSSVIQLAVKELGLDRIIFGTEYPFQAPELELEKMNLLQIGATDLNRNAIRLLGTKDE